MFYCYILKSVENNSYYIGATEDVGKRLEKHNSGKVISTKHNKPWNVIHVEIFSSLSDARKRETQIKNWKSRAAIERLIRTFTI